mgnify:CR=1 FL=1
MNKKILIILATFSLNCLALTPSKGCTKPPPDVPFPGEAFKFVDIYNDKILGPTERNYIVYIPETYNGDETNMLVFDMHGLHGSADGQSQGFWRQTTLEGSFLGLFKHGVGQGDILNANDFFQTNLFRATQTNS